MTDLLVPGDVVVVWRGRRVVRRRDDITYEQAEEQRGEAA